MSFMVSRFLDCVKERGVSSPSVLQIPSCQYIQGKTWSIWIDGRVPVSELPILRTEPTYCKLWKANQTSCMKPARHLGFDTSKHWTECVLILLHLNEMTWDSDSKHTHNMFMFAWTGSYNTLTSCVGWNCLLHGLGSKTPLSIAPDHTTLCIRMLAPLIDRYRRWYGKAHR
jgi:hypothetical protein